MFELVVVVVAVMMESDDHHEWKQVTNFEEFLVDEWKDEDVPIPMSFLRVPSFFRDHFLQELKFAFQVQFAVRWKNRFEILVWF